MALNSCDPSIQSCPVDTSVSQELISEELVCEDPNVDSFTMLRGPSTFQELVSEELVCEDPDVDSFTMQCFPSSELAEICKSKSGGYDSSTFAASHKKIEEIHVSDIYNLQLEPGIDYKIHRIQDENIYHIEFASKLAQGRAFNRLRVFIESDANAGIILNDEELSAAFDKGQEQDGIGHDYTIENICHFYTEARNQGIKLNESEEQIKNDLIQAGLITDQTNIFCPTQHIAVISAAQDIPIRTATINHEHRHGIYMTDSIVREQVDEVWDSLSEHQQAQMKRAIHSLDNYDVENRYLLLNELFASVLDPTSGLSRMPYDKDGTAAFLKLEDEFWKIENTRILRKQREWMFNSPEGVDFLNNLLKNLLKNQRPQ